MSVEWRKGSRDECRGKKRDKDKVLRERNDNKSSRSKPENDGLSRGGNESVGPVLAFITLFAIPAG